MIADAIKTLPTENIDENILASFDIMLNNNTFKEYHPVIKEKISEYEEMRRKLEPPKKDEVEGIKVGDMFLTNNGSLVSVLVSATEKNETLHKVMVVKGGFNPKGMKTEKLQVLFGSVHGDIPFTDYVINDKGQYLHSEDDEKFPMHLLHKLIETVDENGITYTKIKKDSEKTT